MAQHWHDSYALTIPEVFMVCISCYYMSIEITVTLFTGCVWVHLNGCYIIYELSTLCPSKGM